MAESIIYSLKIEGTDEELRALKSMSDTMKTLRDDIKKAGKEGSREAEKKKLQLQNEQKSYRDLQKQIQNQNKETATSVRTLESMRARLAGMNKELEKVKFGGQRFKELTAESKKLRDEINGAQEATGRFQGNVGNYSNAIQSAFQKMGISVGGYTKAVGAATTATRVLGSALIGTGIGAIVVAVGLLAKAFFSTERGTQALSRVLEPLRAIMQRLWGIVQELAVGLVDAFKDPQQAIKDLWELLKSQIVNRINGIIDQFKALGRVIKGVFTLDMDEITQGAKDFGDAYLQTMTGVEDVVGKVKQGFKDLNDELREAAKIGSRIADINIQLKELAVERAKNESRLNREMEEQRSILDDVTKSTTERLAAGEKYNALQEQLLSYDKQQAQLEFERLKIKAELNDTDLVAQAELATAEARLDEIEATRLIRSREVNNKINAILKQQGDNVIRLRDEYTKMLDTVKPGLVEINTELDKWLDFYDKDYQMQTLHLQRTGDNLAFERELYAQTYAGRAEAMQRMFDAGEIGEKRLASLQKQLAREGLKAKLETLNAGLQGMAEIFGETSKAGKAAAVASALISTYLAANQAMTNPPFMPWSAVYAAAAIAQGLGNVRRIMAVKEPAINVRPVKGFATGVIGINGKGSETSDSIPARISRGESVITAKATKVFAPVLANMERAVGNVPNTQLKNRRFASGLIGQRFLPRTDMAPDYERIIQRTIEAVGDIPVLVSETDITGTQELVRKIKVTGDLK
jgi:hypothetical protein